MIALADGWTEIQCRLQAELLGHPDIRGSVCIFDKEHLHIKSHRCLHN